MGDHGNTREKRSTWKKTEHNDFSHSCNPTAFLNPVKNRANHRWCHRSQWSRSPFTMVSVGYNATAAKHAHADEGRQAPLTVCANHVLACSHAHIPGRTGFRRTGALQLQPQCNHTATADFPIRQGHQRVGGGRCWGDKEGFNPGAPQRAQL